MITPDEAAARRAERRRQSWTAQVFRPGEEQAMEETHLRYWLEISPDERAAFVWKLSVEAHELANEERVERRLPRSAYRVVRR